MCDSKKRGFFGRMFRFLFWSIAGLLVFAVVLAVTLPLWVSPVVTGVAGKVVPGYTGTDFHIDRFYLNPYSGTLGIGGVKLSNPKGFGNAAAFSLSRFNLEVAVGSLFSDTVVVREVAIDDAFVSYYSSEGKNNFDVILANVNKAMGADKDDKGVAKKEEPAASKKKVIIDHFRIAGTKVKLMKSDMMPALPLPTIELTDIGRKSNGATMEEAFAQISAAVMKSMSSVGDGLGALGGILGDGAKDISGIVTTGTKDLTKALDDVSGKAGKSLEAIKKSGDGVMSGIVNATKGASSETSGSLKVAAESVGSTAKSATEAIGGAAKGTVDAVGDTTKKAAEGVKNLFKGFGK